MGAMASQITSLMIVYSTVYSDTDQRKHQTFASLVFVWRIHRWPAEFPEHRASNAENVFIWWRHHENVKCFFILLFTTTKKVRGRGHSSSGIVHLRAVPQEMLNVSIIKIRVRVKITHFRLKPLITYYILQDSDILFNPTNVKCRHVAKNENQGVKVCISSNYKENSNLIFLHAVNTRW